MQDTSRQGVVRRLNIVGVAALVVAGVLAAAPGRAQVPGETQNLSWCGTVCSSNNIPSPTCNSGSCNGACAAGFLDCNGNKRLNGCEINSTNDNNNCGTCGHVCPTATFCVAGGCFAP